MMLTQPPICTDCTGLYSWVNLGAFCDLCKQKGWFANAAHLSPMVHPEGVSTAATMTMMQLCCVPDLVQLRPQLYTTSDHDSSGRVGWWQGKWVCMCAHVVVRVVRRAGDHMYVHRHDGLHTCTCSHARIVGGGWDGKVGKGKQRWRWCARRQAWGWASTCVHACVHAVVGEWGQDGKQGLWSMHAHTCSLHTSSCAAVRVVSKSRRAGEHADLHQIGWMQDQVHFLCVARHLTQYLRFHLIPTVKMLSKLKYT